MKSSPRDFFILFSRSFCIFRLEQATLNNINRSNQKLLPCRQANAKGKVRKIRRARDLFVPSKHTLDARSSIEGCFAHFYHGTRRQ